MPNYNKYSLYERAVQSPETHVAWFSRMYREVRGTLASRLREDFCGTFRISCEWVKSDKRHTAIGLDLDEEPLKYGRQNHYSRLSSEQKKRLKVFNKNVLTVTSPKADLIIAGNFSFYIFKERQTLIKYLRACLKSLNQDGILILEMVGGPGMIATAKEQKAVGKRGHRSFTYIWDQLSFDPISHDGFYAIHFKFPNGKVMKNVFTYDWRVWTIPEVREAMEEAGFKSSCVYWETEHEGKGTGEFTMMEVGTNDYSWCAYLVGIK